MLTATRTSPTQFRVIWQIDPVTPRIRLQHLRAGDHREGGRRKRDARNRWAGADPKILTADRKLIEPASQLLMQKILDSYHSGVQVVQVLLLSVDPPAQVITAFRDVTAAQQDLQRLGNEADAYANRVVPEARGAAGAHSAGGRAYREQTVAEAQGQASRFTQITNSTSARQR